jgi:tetraacyldisaccharide 4'-kinase
MGDGLGSVLRLSGSEGALRITHHASRLWHLLLPLAWIYGLVVRIRTWLYMSGWLLRHRLPCRVVSVGNLTVGGTGKTPLVIALAEWLTARGKRVGVLSRGYGRRSRSERVLVSDGSRVLAGPAEAGDEPHLIARRCPGVVVAVGSDRFRLGRWVLERFPVEVLLLDDGFQHLGLQRDADVVLVDAADPAGIRRLLPAGRLREPMSAVARAHLVLLTSAQGTDECPEVRASLDAAGMAGRPCRVRFAARKLVKVGTGEESDLDQVRDRPAVVVSGIGNPASFRRLVEDLGIRVVDELRFGDHHAYTSADVHRIRERAVRCGARWVLTTEKDAVKLGTLVSPDDPVWAVRLEADMAEAKPALERLILAEDA